MSGHHDTHHVDENKPVAFTVPMILAIVTLIVVILFLSLCDPSHAHHNSAGHNEGHAGPATSKEGLHNPSNHTTNHAQDDNRAGQDGATERH